MTLLDAIVAHKREEIALLPEVMATRRDHPSLVSAVMNQRPSLIAEIKPISPSGGRLLELKDVPSQVALFNRHAQAISILCDHQFFGGGFDLLAEVRSLTSLPLLAKEFILSERQIHLAALHGADAILLIAAILSGDDLRHLMDCAFNLGLDVLLESHSQEDVTKIAEVLRTFNDARREHLLLGINNRDLHTGKMNLLTTKLLAGMLRDELPTMRAVIAESGISAPRDVRRLAPFVQGFLIGTSLLKASDHKPLFSCFSPES
ncbi:MAG: indole-3-glycerol phosphate synthase TrpC [Candidatus Peregrinibacteria bacterium]